MDALFFETRHAPHMTHIGHKKEAGTFWLGIFIIRMDFLRFLCHSDGQMRPQIELGHLKYFYFTVLEGGVGPAADRLCVQQPVVSKMIKSLESQFGQSLFRKEGRKNALTDFGQLVFRHSQNIFNEVEKVGLLEANPITAGTLNIGAAEPIAAHVLPVVLDPLTTEFPLVHCNVYTATAAQLLAMISDGKLDVGLFFHLGELPSNLEVTDRIPTRFNLVVSAKESKNPKVLSSFIGSREVDDLSNHKFPTLELLKKSYPQARITFSSNHLGLHKQMVLKGKGVSILPRFLLEEELKNKKLSQVFPKEKFLFDLKIVTRKTQSPSSKFTHGLIERLKNLKRPL